MVHFTVDIPFSGMIPDKRGYQYLVDLEPDQQDGHEQDVEEDYSAKEWADMREICHRLGWYYLILHVYLTIYWIAHHGSNSKSNGGDTIGIAMIMLGALIYFIQTEYSRVRKEYPEKLRVLYV